MKGQGLLQATKETTVSIVAMIVRHITSGVRATIALFKAML
jgi:hypothetical protein